MDKTLSAGALLSVFPNDGEIAWLCQSGTKIAPGPLHVWRTHDGGATWQTLSVAQIDKAISCQISLDQLDPDVAILDVEYISHTTPAQVTGANYSTLDGGASWQAAPLILPMTDFATLNGATYAIRQDGTDANRLEVSKDGLRTWNYVDDPIQRAEADGLTLLAQPEHGRPVDPGHFDGWGWRNLALDGGHQRRQTGSN